MIIRNSAKCLQCGDEVESKHRHDYRSCSCFNVFVDGGTAYLRHGWKLGFAYENTSVVHKDGETIYYEGHKPAPEELLRLRRIAATRKFSEGMRPEDFEPASLYHIEPTA